MAHPPPRQRSWTGGSFDWLFLGIAALLFSGCGQEVPVRVYDAPKSDTQFVAGPMAGSEKSAGRVSSPPASGPRRILGAVIPMESGCYFLKATDTPERLEPLSSDFRAIVTQFQVDATTGKPQMALPEGWTMNPRNDIALAEFISPEALGSVKFTVTVLGMPPESEWSGYLLSNINRWRGQLSLPELDSQGMANELLSVNRPGSLIPGYLFDATGTGSGTMSLGGPASPGGPARTTPPIATTTTPPSPSSTSSTSLDTQPAGAKAPQPPELQYTTPEGWELAPGAPFRLATFRIQSPEGEGEVTVSLAVDNPLANSIMWHQQITREQGEARLKELAEASIASAETIPAGNRQAALYTIRDSEQLDAPMLLVASLPTERPDLHLFVKLRGDNRLVQSQRDQLLRFVDSLSLK